MIVYGALQGDDSSMRKYPTHNTPAGTAVLLVVMAAVLCYVVYMYATVPGMEWD